MAPHWDTKYPFALFFGIIVIASWVGGYLPGLLSMALGWLSVVWVLPHLGAFRAEEATLWGGQVLFFSQSALIVIGFATMNRRLQMISKKRQAEAALRQSQRKLAESAVEAQMNLTRLKLIEGAVNAGTWEFDIATGISHWPAGISSLWGLPAEDHFIPLDDFVSRIYIEDRDRIVAIVQDSIASGKSYDVEFRVVWPDQSVHWLQARGAVLNDDNGKPAKVIGIALEVTQRRHTENALRESEKLAATGRMAATIAHEINNPLEAVVNLIYLSRHDATLSPQTRDYLDSADAELNRVGYMVRQTLGFYRENSQPVWIDAGNLVDMISAVFRNKMTRKNVQLDTEVEHAEIFGVEGELRQVVSNLISNAIDAVEIDGRIRIRVRRVSRGNHSYVRILVADNGHGISRENRCKVFQPFFTTKASIGTGLGLWVTKGIVDKHNGHISLRTSTIPHRTGTVFCVDLPAERTVASVQAAASPL